MGERKTEYVHLRVGRDIFARNGPQKRKAWTRPPQGGKHGLGQGGLVTWLH
jgi:hypothetical protein